MLARQTIATFALATSVSLFGCGAVETAAAFLVPPDQEVALGLQLSDELETQLVLHPDPSTHAYLSSLGNQIVGRLENVPPEYAFEFHVVDDDATVNAFAVPGGQIYFYTGLLLSAANEAEVMGVLSHEIAHVTQRHGAEQMVTQFGLETVLGMALGENPSQIAALVGQLGATGALLQNSRSDETEADEVGLTYLLAVGYDPEPFIGFFDRLEQLSGGAALPEFLSTHPKPENRADNLRSIVRRLGDVPTYRGDDAAFAAFQASL